MARRLSPAAGTCGGLVIELDSVSLRFGTESALREVSFRICPGEHWLLLGANGAGKTVLLKLLRGDLWPTPTRRGRRRYLRGGEALLPYEIKSRIAYLGAERQDKYERYGWNLRVEDVVATGLEDSDLPSGPLSGAVRGTVRGSLASVGLEGLARRRFLHLSYGQRRRVLLARALVSQPDVLLLDEVANGLDDRSRRAVLRALEHYRDGAATWVFGTHRDAEVPAGVTHVLELRQGRVRSRREVAARGAERPAGAPRPRRVQAPSRRRVRGARAGRAAELFALQRATVFREGRPVLREIDWTVLAGEHWCITGPNGSGKSTLLAAVFGDLPVALGGTLRRAGVPRGTPLARWRQDVGLVSPELQATCAATSCTLEEIVASGAHSSIGLDEPLSAAGRRRARRWLSRLGLAGLAPRRAREVSYGQLRRALIARALSRRRRLLLLDEPFDGLDAASRATLLGLLRGAARRGTTIVIAAHHDADLPGFVTRRLRLLPDGRAQIGSLAS